MPGSPTTPGWPSARVGALGHIAFHYTDSVGTRKQFSIAAQWLACTFPADASPTSLRMPAHGLGPMWVATPSSQWTCTTYSLPVSRRTRVKTCASQESVELFSLLPSSDSRRQQLLVFRLTKWEELSTSKLNARVFAQPGSIASILQRLLWVRFASVR